MIGDKNMAIEMKAQGEERFIRNSISKTRKESKNSSKKKSFVVTVTAAKYSGWRSGEMYRKMGGLWGLCVGADRTRIIKIRVRIKRWVPWFIADKALDELEQWHDFEKIIPGVINGGSPYYADYAIKEQVIKLSSYDKEEQKREVKELCENIKEEIEDIMREVFEGIGKFEPETE